MLLARGGQMDVKRISEVAKRNPPNEKASINATE